MASANERRWAGRGRGSDVESRTGASPEVKGSKPNNCIFHLGTFAHPALFAPFFALVVFRPRRWSVATSVPLLRHQLRPSLPPVFPAALRIIE